MSCHVCGGNLEAIISDLPFKLDLTRIVIVKGLPVLQCGQCGEYLIEDRVMARVDQILERADVSAELEIFHYAA